MILLWIRTPGKKGSVAAVDAAVRRAAGDDRDRENSRLAFVTTSAVDGLTTPFAHLNYIVDILFHPVRGIDVGNGKRP